MKNHVVVKLRRPVPEPPVIPDWVSFITDKSREVTSVDRGASGGVDEVLHAAGREFWVTHEYAPAGDTWSPEEIHHGLQRTYRLVMWTEQALADDVLQRLAAVPSVQSCHQLEVAATPLPEPEHAVAATTAVPDRDELIGVDFAHALTRGRPDVRVAVLDTGADLDHPELAGRLEPGADFVDLEGLDATGFVGDVLGWDDVPQDELGHGTHVAGIVAAGGRRMPAGVAPECRIIPVRVLATLRDGGRFQGAGIVDNINPGIKWAVDNGADVINMSLGIRHTGGGLPHADVIRYALARDVTVVAASGNDGTATKYYPGALPGVIAVGAVDERGHLASFSSYGAPITVVAPGVNVLSAFARGRYEVASGTSQASPCVAGAVALFQSLARDHGRRLRVRDVATLLRETSDRPDGRLRTNQHGYGLLNLTDAFKWLLDSLN